MLTYFSHIDGMQASTAFRFLSLVITFLVVEVKLLGLELFVLTLLVYKLFPASFIWLT